MSDVLTTLPTRKVFDSDAFCPDSPPQRISGEWVEGDWLAALWYKEYEDKATGEKVVILRTHEGEKDGDGDCEGRAATWKEARADCWEAFQELMQLWTENAS